MNIHHIYTFPILLLVMVEGPLATAQPIWDTVYGYHHHYDNYEWPLIEIRQPKFLDRFFDDDLTQSLRRFHLYEPLDRPPIIYLPRIQFVPDVYAEERFPHTYSRFEEPISHPYRSRLLTTLSVSYKAKLLPVVDYNDEDKETVASDTSENAPQEVNNSGNGSNVATKGTTKKDTNVGTKNTNPSQGGVKAVTPKPNIKAEPVTKPAAAAKPDIDETNTEPATVAGNNVDAESKPVDEVINTPVVGNADPANVAPTPETKLDATKDQSVPTTTSAADDATNSADVPTA